MVETFCVECGRVGPTYGGLCQEDYAERHILLTPPETVDLPECVHCQKLLTPRGWETLSLSDAIIAALTEETKREKAVTRVVFVPTITDSEDRQRDIEVTAAVHVEDFDVTRRFTVTVRLPRATCSDCSRQRGNYFESILQLRTTSGVPDETLRKDVTKIVEDSLTDASSDFVSRIEKVRGGIDFFLSKNSTGRKIAKLLGETYGAETKSAAKLWGRLEGKEIYRVTYLVRVPVAGKRRR